MNDTTGRRGSVTSASASRPEIGRTAYASAGQPASRTIAWSARAESGVCEAGFWTTGAPTAIAGATLWAVRLSGKLKGVIARTGPSGTRFTTPHRATEAAFTSSGSISPFHASRAAAAAENVAEARSTSVRAALSGLPASARDRPSELVPPRLEGGGDAPQDRDAHVRRERARLLEDGDGLRDRRLDLGGGRPREARDLRSVERRADDEDLRLRHDFSSLRTSGFHTRGAVQARAEKSAERARPRSGGRPPGLERVHDARDLGRRRRRHGEARERDEARGRLGRGPSPRARRGRLSSAGVSGVTPVRARRPAHDGEKERQVAQDGHGRLEAERRERRRARRPARCPRA